MISGAHLHLQSGEICFSTLAEGALPFARTFDQLPARSGTVNSLKIINGIHTNSDITISD